MFEISGEKVSNEHLKEPMKEKKVFSTNRVQQVQEKGRTIHNGKPNNRYRKEHISRDLEIRKYALTEVENVLSHPYNVPVVLFRDSTL